MSHTPESIASISNIVVLSTVLVVTVVAVLVNFLLVFPTLLLR